MQLISQARFYDIFNKTKTHGYMGNCDLQVLLSVTILLSVLFLQEIADNWIICQKKVIFKESFLK